MSSESCPRGLHHPQKSRRLRNVLAAGAVATGALGVPDIAAAQPPQTTIHTIKDFRVCADTDSGKKATYKNLQEEFHAEVAGQGFKESPGQKNNNDVSITQAADWENNDPATHTACVTGPFTQDSVLHHGSYSYSTEPDEKSGSGIPNNASHSTFANKGTGSPFPGTSAPGSTEVGVRFTDNPLCYGIRDVKQAPDPEDIIPDDMLNSADVTGLRRVLGDIIITAACGNLGQFMEYVGQDGRSPIGAFYTLATEVNGGITDKSARVYAAPMWGGVEVSPDQAISTFSNSDITCENSPNKPSEDCSATIDALDAAVTFTPNFFYEPVSVRVNSRKTADQSMFPYIATFNQNSGHREYAVAPYSETSTRVILEVITGHEFIHDAESGAHIADMMRVLTPEKYSELVASHIEAFGKYMNAFAYASSKDVVNTKYRLPLQFESLTAQATLVSNILDTFGPDKEGNDYAAAHGFADYVDPKELSKIHSLADNVLAYANRENITGKDRKKLDEATLRALHLVAATWIANFQNGNNTDPGIVSYYNDPEIQRFMSEVVYMVGHLTVASPHLMEDKPPKGDLDRIFWEDQQRSFAALVDVFMKGVGPIDFSKNDVVKNLYDGALYKRRKDNGKPTVVTTK